MSTALEQPAKSPELHHRGFISKLITGTGAFNIIGRRRHYYLISAVLVLVAIALMLTRQFNFGIDFAGGTRLQFPSNPSISTDAVVKVVEASTGLTDPTVQTVGSGASSTFQVRTQTLSIDKVVAAKQAIATAFGFSVNQISDSAVSETWGGEISQRAILALIVFLVAVSIFLWLRYERRVAVGAVVAVFHDLILTAGIYSLVGFEVTPSTVIGLLAILGFSLYDTVVVYDKVQENTKGLTSLLRRNYSEAANLAINQTLMRSINTTLIALLPVGGLLVAGVAILGSGTLKDLALVQLVGMIVSGYSSVFLAVPIAVDLRLRDPLIRAHTARVAARRKAEGLIVDADGDPTGRQVVNVGAKPAGAKFASGKKSAVLVEPAELAKPTDLVEASDPVVVPEAPTRGIGTVPQPGSTPISRSQRTAGGRPAGKSGRPSGKRSR